MWFVGSMLAGCTPEPASPSAQVPPPTATATATGATTTGATTTGATTTGATTGATPSTTTTTLPCPPPGAVLAGAELLPSARITAPPDTVDTALIVPAHGDDAGAIVLYDPGTVVPGVPACRDSVADLVKVGDLVGSLPSGRDNLSIAGDVDQDGHLDLWVAGSLVYGPLVGPLDPNTSPTAVTDGWWNVMLGDIDADEDGTVDLLCAIDQGGVGFVTYGPLAGPIAPPYSADFDPSTQTHFWGGSYAMATLPDHRGPGTLAFVVGRPGYDYEWITVYDLPLARGGSAEPVAALYDGADWSDFVALRGTGDIDGDGFGDAIYGSSRSHLRLARGPFEGDPLGEPPGIPLDGGIPIYPAGDVNGDGVGDLVIGRHDGRYGVALSPYTFPIAGADAVILGELTGFETIDHGDLDGDGLEDLVVLYDGSDTSASGVRIWYGAEIAANQ